jgi:hypothetical protein
MRNRPSQSPLSGAGWLALGILIGFLSVAIWYGMHSWSVLGDVRMSAFGWFALIAGSLVTVGVGAGLMALVFYSNRKDFDR